MKFKRNDNHETNADDYFHDIVIGWFGESGNRSEIGKRAYQTFLKNGGKRDSKGRFVGKQKIDWYVLGNECENEFCLPKYSNKNGDQARAYFKVFKKHGLIREGVEI